MSFNPPHKLTFLDGPLNGYVIDGTFDVDHFHQKFRIKFIPSNPNSIEKKARRGIEIPNSRFQITNFDKTAILTIDGETTFRRLIPNYLKEDYVDIKCYETALHLEGDVRWTIIEGNEK